LNFFLNIKATGSQVPHKSPDKTRATYYAGRRSDSTRIIL